MDGAEAVGPSRLSAEQVKALAKEAGFDLCGLARAEPIPPEVLGDWLAAGFDADMDWMGRRAEARLDVTRLLPGARTVVALACNYHPPDDSPSPIARYARGRDYHATMRNRLRALRRGLLASHPGLETWSCVDTGPAMEKVWAARAGLGYVGRNGCLITEAFGSFVVLAVMLLDHEVDAYATGPLVDRCGTCNLCISECPTEAIDEHARVDARRCLSYQTIENEGAVPEPLRFAMSGLVFGCDICQDVCPLNGAPVAAGPRFHPRPVAGLTVRELAAMTPEDYQRLVPGTPLARAQYVGLLRNAAYALGAARDLQARDVLEKLALLDEYRVREAARWALGRLGAPVG